MILVLPDLEIAKLSCQTRQAERRRAAGGPPPAPAPPPSRPRNINKHEHLFGRGVFTLRSAGMMDGEEPE